MSPLAFLAVLLAATTHATWSLYAKRASGSKHFVWLHSIASVVLYAPIVIWIVVTQRLYPGVVRDARGADRPRSAPAREFATLIGTYFGARLRSRMRDDQDAG